MADMKSVEYDVVWRWVHDNAGTRNRNMVKATTAKRAIAKVEAELKREYANVPQDLRIIAAHPSDY